MKSLYFNSDFSEVPMGLIDNEITFLDKLSSVSMLTKISASIYVEKKPHKTTEAFINAFEKYVIKT